MLLGEHTGGDIQSALRMTAKSLGGRVGGHSRETNYHCIKSSRPESAKTLRRFLVPRE